MKQVMVIEPTGIISVYKNAALCARDLGVTIQSISRSCRRGVKCKGCTLRYLNPFTGQIMEPTREKYTGLDYARPVIEYLCGKYADEAIAYIASNHSDRFTYREIKLRFLQWHFKFQRLHIPSDKWATAWERLENSHPTKTA